MSNALDDSPDSKDIEVRNKGNFQILCKLKQLDMDLSILIYYIQENSRCQLKIEK